MTQFLRLISLLCCLTAGVCAHESRPNILFIILDDWGWRDAGAYGSTWVNTPGFDRLAREGVLFNHAFTSNPKCSPSRASILTGRNAWQLREGNVHYSDFPAGLPVYPDLLEKAGYAVGYTGKGWGPGFYDKAGFTRNPAGPHYNMITHDVPATGIKLVDYAANFAHFLSERGDKPFCFWLGAHEPHRPYERDSGLRTGRDPAEVKLPAYYPDDEVIRRDLQDYALEVEYADHQVVRTLEILEDQGLLDDTLIIMTSDHGMPFPRVKGQIFEDGFRLPMVARWGDHLPAGSAIDTFVNLRDLAPTFLAAAGIPAPPTMTGRNLLPLLTGEETPSPTGDFMLIGKERHDIGRPFDQGYPVRAIRTKEWLYVRNYEPERWPAGNPETDYGNCDSSPSKDRLKYHLGHYYELSFGLRPEAMLYHLPTDPECLENLANDPTKAEVLRTLNDQMENALLAEGDPRMLGLGDVFDSVPFLGPRNEKGYDYWLKRQLGWPGGLGSVNK